ncbi:hypothetical protein D915_008947 [Fasciola hepatica]|uniref:Uncharacterized protein n=1 Tax=Fasciola hepatica TaxID=6192 RepID=A0A2H1BX20_FASHE|nr:hypothetical protein D915_008947 [Fasciola hepatica]
MLRVLRTKTCTSSAEQQPGGSQAASKRNKHRKQADLIPSPMHSVIQPLFDLPAVGSRLVILHDWWPVLVNMYVLSLRKRWFYEVSDGQTSTTDEFLIELSQALNVIRHPALSMHQLNGKSQFVTSTNEFQLYKLAAAVSQVYPRGSWTEVFRSYPFEETPILPLAALVWTDDSQAAQSPTSANVPNKRKSEKRSRQSIRFSLTSVCLASAIESMLRHFSIMESLNSTTGEIDTQSSTCLLIAANEYIPTCMVSADSTMNPEYVNTLYTVIKQITRRLPEEFLVNPGQRVAPSTLMMSRNLIVQTVDFRLNQVRVSLLKFCQHSITDRGQSDSPMWFTIVGQARTAVEWYFARLPLPTTEEERRDPVVIKDLIACLSLVHRLIFMQVANLDVLSLSGLMNSLKDLLMTQSVIQILKDLPPDALQIEMPEPAEYHLQCLCFYLFVICHMISSKYRSKPSQRADRKSRKKAATKLDSVSVRDSPILSPEVELADRITAGPPSILRDFQCNDVAAFVQLLKNHDLDSFGPLCRLFAAKVDLLQQHFS